MITSPLAAIKQISKKEDRSHAIIFFLFFSRFEYALKRAGYVAAQEEAKADWSHYARAHPKLISTNKTDPFVKAVYLLKQSPPKKQIIEQDRLAWSDDKFSGDIDLARVLILVCRVRNNLFHGGKFTKGPEADISRDRELVNAGIAIMEACLDADDKLKSLFMADLV